MIAHTDTNMAARSSRDVRGAPDGRVRPRARCKHRRFDEWAFLKTVVENEENVAVLYSLSVTPSYPLECNVKCTRV